MPEIEFVPMKMEHIEEIVSIEKRSYTSPWSRSAFVQEATDNDIASYIVAMDKGKVVGYCGMWLIIDEAHITTIAVDAPYRRRKIGERMLALIIELAKLKCAVAVTLEVRKTNLTAQSLYKKFGFIPSGIRREYYADNKEDAIIMWKEDLKDDR